jgi:hypothetical protein
MQSGGRPMADAWLQPVAMELYRSGKRRDIIKHARGPTYHSIHHREYVFMQAHLACMGVTFTVLLRLFRRFYADTDLFQTSIPECSG